jgi:hypothetical protein
MLLSAAMIVAGLAPSRPAGSPPPSTWTRSIARVPAPGTCSNVRQVSAVAAQGGADLLRVERTGTVDLDRVEGEQCLQGILWHEQGSAGEGGQHDPVTESSGRIGSVQARRH